MEVAVNIKQALHLEYSFVDSFFDAAMVYCCWSKLAYENDEEILEIR